MKHKDCVRDPAECRIDRGVQCGIVTMPRQLWDGAGNKLPIGDAVVTLTRSLHCVTCGKRWEEREMRAIGGAAESGE